MIKKTKTKIYDTDTATVVKKVTSGAFGDPAGYEVALYQTPDGDFFFYSNGGAESAYPEEKIACCSKAKAEAWRKENAGTSKETSRKRRLFD